MQQFRRPLGLSGSGLAAKAPGEPAGVSRCTMCPGISGIGARCVRKRQAIEQPPAMKEYDDPAIQTEGALSLAARHWSLQHVASGQPGQGVRIGPEVQWRETLSETKPGKYRLMRIDRPARFGVKRASLLLKLLKRLKKQRASAGRCPTSAILRGRMSFAGSRGLARRHGQLSSVNWHVPARVRLLWETCCREEIVLSSREFPERKIGQRKESPICAGLLRRILRGRLSQHAERPLRLRTTRAARLTTMPWADQSL